MDRSGKTLGTLGEAAEIANPVLSPDDKRVLVTIRDPGTKTRDLWVVDSANGTSSRLTFDPADDYNPVWSPDGNVVLFSSNRKGKKDLYRKRADGVGDDELLFASAEDKNVDSLSPDGQSLLYNVTATGKPMGLWLVPLSGDRKPATFAAGASASRSYGAFSPNGRWIAFMSNNSGTQQIFVQTAPGSGLPEGKWQVSRNGGTMPQWRRDGKELFFLDGATLMAAPVKADGASFEAAPPTKLFEIRPGVSLRNHFTVSLDGQRFLFAWPKDADDADQIHVLLNWPARLRATLLP